jgi:hypothetical protein
MGKGNPEIRVRAAPRLSKRWREAATARGETLSAFVRAACEERASRQPEGGVVESCPEQHASPARALARAKAPTSLEERLSALAELAEGLGRSSG